MRPDNNITEDVKKCNSFIVKKAFSVSLEKLNKNSPSVRQRVPLYLLPPPLLLNLLRGPWKWVAECAHFDFPTGQFVSVRTFLIAATIFWIFPIFPFSYCPLSRVLLVTLANWQFGLEFHLRSSSAFSEYMDGWSDLFSIFVCGPLHHYV